MKSDSKIYRFFFGRRGETRLPFGAMLLILVPFFIGGLYFQDTVSLSVSDAGH